LTAPADASASASHAGHVTTFFGDERLRAIGGGQSSAPDPRREVHR